ncbi:MAG: GNAT family N-acetyltransferase [Pacificimonas sp.]
MIETERLILREWRDEDIAPYAEMMADPEVMQTLGKPMDRATAMARIDSLKTSLRERGFTRLAITDKTSGMFLGYCGLQPVEFMDHLRGELEIGWGLRRAVWDHGYATEAASATLAWAWRNLDMARVFGFTTKANGRSQSVMQRIGMSRRPELDFDHPKLATDDPLRPHVVYSIQRPAT